MSSANVLPSPPEYAETGQQLYPTHEITQFNAEDFRLKKISDLETELTNETDHYRQVAKKNTKEHIPSHTSQLSALVQFLLTVISNPGNSFDWFWDCCKPCACWRCDCFRIVFCWLCYG